VLAAFVVGAVAYAPLYCYPLLAPQFETAFHTSRELGQLPWTMFLVISAACSPILGRAFDVVADRLLLLVGAVLLAAGWFVASAASDVVFLTAAYGALLAIGVQLVFVGTTTAVARRYAGVAGLALGVAYAGPGIGVAVALPIAAGLIPQIGWREAGRRSPARACTRPPLRERSPHLRNPCRRAAIPATTPCAEPSARAAS
jgi:MFS family permease